MGKPQKIRRKESPKRAKREESILPVEYANDFIKQAKTNLRSARGAKFDGNRDGHIDFWSGVVVALEVMITELKYGRVRAEDC